MGFDQIKVDLCSTWGGDRDAANAAWASTFNKSTVDNKTDEQVAKVVTDVVHLHHDTPKERLWMEFFITCPIFIERQFDKYRMTLQYQQFSVEWFEAPMGRDHITQNELSGRYRTIPDRPYILPKDVIDTCDKGSGKSTFWDGSYPLSHKWQYELERQHELYKEILDALRINESNGVITNAEYKRAREVLRGLLGTAYLTDMRIVMNMNAFEHIINQRLARAAQTESRVVAYLMVAEMLDKLQSGATILREMIKANDWEPLIQEIKQALQYDKESQVQNLEAL